MYIGRLLRLRVLPKQTFKACREGEIWVEPLATSNLKAVALLPFPRQKKVYVLKA